MNNASDKTVNQIMRLMCEMDPTGLTNNIVGGVSTPVNQPYTTLNQSPFGGDRYENNCDDYPDFTEQEMRLAKKFVELVGCPERATELLNKVAECEDCLGLIDDSETDEIGFVASTVPMAPDMPTMMANMM